MRTASRCLSAAALMALAALPARAAVTMPSCAALEAFVAPADFKPLWLLGDRNTDLALAEAVHGPAFSKLFGAAALDWTPDEARATSKAIVRCAHELGHARKRAEARKMGYFAKVVAHIGTVRIRLDRAYAAFDKDFKALIDLPPSRDKLAALMVLDRARAGGPAVHQAEAYARTITDSNASKQIHGAPARGLGALFTILRRAPDGIGDRMYPALTRQIAALIPQVAAQQAARADAVPATLAGLQSLPRLRQDIDKEVRLVLPPGAYQTVADHIAAREAAIQDAVQADTLARIAKAPPGGPGLSMLDTIGHGPALAALTPPRAQTVQAAIASRRNALLDSLADATIARIGQFPPTLDGLAQLVGYIRQIRPNLAQDAGPDRTHRIEGAARTRATAIATAVLPAFKNHLAGLGEDRPGLLAANAAWQQVNSVLAIMQPAMADQYKSAFQARHDAIAAAVQAEDARLQALPLPGATYATGSGYPSLQFRNRDHAYLAVAPDNTLAVTYEVDGAKVILHGLPQGALVLERQGGTLVGNGLRLRRKAG